MCNIISRSDFGWGTLLRSELLVDLCLRKQEK